MRRQTIKNKILYTVHYQDGLIQKQSNKDWTLLRALRSFNIPVPFSCGGEGICTTCRVIVTNGDVTERTDLERDRAIERGFNDSERLSCQCKPLSDSVEVKIP